MPKLGSYQFKLWHTFYATALFAVAFSFSFGLLIAAAIWITICEQAAVLPTRAARVRKAALLVFLAIFASCCIGGLLLPPLSTPRHVSRRMQCGSNMRQLMLAIHNYNQESTEGQFPHPSSSDISNGPEHSWRVRILPFIDEQELYDQYDFNEPWDSPKNRKLIKRMPDLFRCPCCNHDKTHYKLVVGKGSLFDGGPATFARIVDGSSNTIALIEDASNPIEWTRPSDATIEEAIAAVRILRPTDAPHVHESAFNTTYQSGNFARFDGSISTTGSFKGPREEIRKLFGIDDGIPEEAQLLTNWESFAFMRLTPWISLGTFFLLMLYPLSWVLGKASDGNAPNSEAAESVQ